MRRLFRPFVSPQAVKNVVRVLRGYQLAEGEQVRLFEKEFGEKFHKKYVLALNSGTSALELAYELAGIKEGDEVVSPVLTCVATNVPLKRRGAKIIWADIEEDLNIDVEDVKRKLTPRTKAIVFVHFGGNNRGLREILRIGKEYNIKVIEDAAQAVGSDYWGHADFTAVSFQAIKTLTTGDGGALIVKKYQDYKRGYRLRWFGIDRKKRQKYGDVDFYELGYKYHMNDISAAIGRGNLKVVDRLIAHRKRLMKVYAKYGFIANIWFSVGFSDKRSRLIKYCRSRGIELGIHHFRNDKYTAFEGKRLKLPNMDWLEDKYYLLPMNQTISIKDAKYIGKTIRDYEGK